MHTSKRCRQKLKQRNQDVDPETALEYFQVSVNILEARKLAWTNPHSMNSYVELMLGNEKHRTNIKKNMEEPCYKEWFFFEWYATVREMQRTNLCLAVMEAKCCAASPRLLGETNINLGTIWAQPNHQVFHKWSQLYNPLQLETGAVGFLKMDISIICRGDAEVMPLTTQCTIDRNCLPSISLEQQRALYQITVFSAYGLPSGIHCQQRYGMAAPPSTYVKVSFAGLSIKTAVQYRNRNPAYCEQISITESFPSPYQVVRFEVCPAEAFFNKVLASAELRLENISHDGENGFLPTFGPSLLHMYGSVSSGLERSGEDGPFHKGALLVALRTLVPYYQQDLRSTNIEPVTAVPLDDLWTYQDFCVLCTILEVSMLDKSIIGKSCGVAITIGEIPSDNKSDKDFSLIINEIKSRKLHYTGSLRVTTNNDDYGHLNLSNGFPVLQMAARLPDFRSKVFMNNMVRTILDDLDNVLSSIEEKLIRVHYILVDLTEELRNGVNKAATNIRTLLDNTDLFDQKHGRDKCKDFKTELECKQIALQRDELLKIYQQLTKKVKGGSVNLSHLVSGSSKETIYLTKKEIKYLLVQVNTLIQKIRSLLFEGTEGWPDIVMWLLNGVSRVASYKISLADVIYSNKLEQRGVHCGRIHTIYLKPIKCHKHYNAPMNSCTCIAGKIETLVWMGVHNQTTLFEDCLPKEYKLKKKGFEMCIKTTKMMLLCRVFINRAKLFTLENSTPLGLFVRIHALNTIKETKVEPNTLTPSWNVVLKIQSIVLVSESRLISNPPNILVEVLNTDLLGKADIVGRADLKPTVDDTPDYQSAPKLQWFKIQRGIEETGQILMSAQILQIPETLIKSTFYSAVDETCSENQTKQMVPQSPHLEKLPPCLMPKSVTYKVDIYWWGLRDVSITRKPCAVFEIEDLVIKSDIIPEILPNCNFPNGRTSHTFEAPTNELQSPLTIKLCDCSTFGRTLSTGTTVIKNPNKYMVEWIPKFTREESLRSVSILSSNFLRGVCGLIIKQAPLRDVYPNYLPLCGVILFTISDSLYIKKSTTSAEESTVYSKTIIGNSIFQMHTKTPTWKKIFFKKKRDEEKVILLHAFGNDRENIDYNVAKKSNIPERQDWWLRFFTSLKEHTNENSKLRNIKIYDSELESQPDFFKFKDWCKTMNIYRGKKTGIIERDVKLKCGVLKAGIAIYKWPPPSNTEVVNSVGVDLVHGFFEDLPVNDPVKYLIRVYIVRGLNLTHNLTGYSDPYLLVNCGSRHYKENKSSESSPMNPVFGKMIEFECCLPQDYLLTVSLALSPNEMIGHTTIDLEDRIYSKHRAKVGLPTEYHVTGPAKWRDCVKPSLILDEICIKNHIPPPIFPDNDTVIFNEIQYKNTDHSNKTYISASECKEDICLELLKKWHTLPLCGYRLVPEHVESRKLINPDKPEVAKGKIQMWVDIFPLDTGAFIPLPVDISLRKVENYELRVTICCLQYMKEKVKKDNKIRKNIFLKAWIGFPDLAKYSKIYSQSNNGKCDFNWCMIFNFHYQHANKTMILKDKGVFTEEEEHMPPVLIIQVKDYDATSDVDYLGMLSFHLNSIPKGSKFDEERIHANENSRINLFSTKSIRGWWPLKHIDRNTGITRISGFVELEMHLLPKELALLMPVGLGRESSSPLPIPRRQAQFQCLREPSLLETTLTNFSIEYLVIGVIVITVAAAFYWGIIIIY